MIASVGAFLTSQLDYLLFVCGLLLAYLALISVLLYKRAPQTAPWLFLSGFAGFQAFHDWVWVYSIAFHGSGFLLGARHCLALISFIFLFEFARRGSSRPRLAKLLLALSGAAALSFILSGILGGTSLMNAVVRYGAGLPASIFAFVALLQASGKLKRYAGILRHTAATLAATALVFSLFPANAWSVFLRLILAFFLATGAWIYWHALNRDELRRMGKTGAKDMYRWVAPTIAAFTLLGWLVTHTLGTWEDNILKERTLVVARGAAAAISRERLNRVLLLPVDSAERNHLLEVIRNEISPILSASDETIDTHVIILKASRFQNVLVVPGPTKSAGMNPGLSPLALLEEPVVAQIRDVLLNSETRTYSSADDNTITNLLLPVRDADSGRNLAVLGVEIDNTTRLQAIANIRFFPILATALLAATLTALFSTILRTERSAVLARLSESRFKDIAHSSVDLIWEIDPDLNYTYCSNQVRQLLGYSPEELAGKSILNQMSDEGISAIHRAIATLATERSSVTGFECRFMRKDGRAVSLAISMTRALNAEGTTIGFRGTSRNVTAHTHTESELKRANEMYRVMLDAARDGILVIDLTGTVLEYNERFRELFRIPADLIATRDYNKLLVYAMKLLKNADAVIADAEMARQADAPATSMVMEFKDGTLLERYSVPRILEGRGNGRVIFYRDITERARMEDEAAQMQRQMFMTSKLASLGELAAGVAHEINNPLAIVKGYIPVLEQAFESHHAPAPVPASVMDILGKQDRAVDRIAEIVNGLRTYARSDTLQFEPVNVHAVITDTIELLQHIYRKNGVQIEFKPQATHVVIRASIGKLQQVLMNLLSNAKDAINARKKEGVITIVTANCGDNVKISVADTGTGISPGDVTRIFNAFFTTKPPGKGTGLGLAITHSIVHSLGGTIDVESKPGHGATFFIVLPLTHDKLVTADPAAAITTKKKILGKALVVDDEPEIVEQIADQLRSFGLEVRTALDGIAALKLAEQEPLDYLVTDLRMPRMSGKELIEAARARSNLKDTTIIAISGGVITETSASEMEELRTMVDGHLRKPFSSDQLHELLVSHRRRLV